MLSSPSSSSSSSSSPPPPLFTPLRIASPQCHVVEESVLTFLPTYSQIPIRFEVSSRYDVVGDDPETAQLVERSVSPPWVKDYDASHEDRPPRWLQRWDISSWGVLAAYESTMAKDASPSLCQPKKTVIGGCVIAFDTVGVNMLHGRKDLAVLWDIRVCPDCRGRGVGFRLFQAAKKWARLRGCVQLNVETQDINVGACRFYRRQGCVLSSIKRGFYADLPEEIALIWSVSLD